MVKLIVEILEPFHGKILDPAAGSAGMFVQSARFVQERQQNPNAEISVYGQERVAETVRLAKMNLAVHNLGGDIREGNTYYYSAISCFPARILNRRKQRQQRKSLRSVPSVSSCSTI